MSGIRARKSNAPGSTVSSSGNMWPSADVVTLVAIAATHNADLPQAATSGRSGVESDTGVKTPGFGFEPEPGRSPSTPSEPGVSPAFVPADGQYANQWHLFDMGNLQKIWDEFDGSGVNVGVYDTGVQSHFDLDAHYNPALHINIGGTVYLGRAYTPNEWHGTAVAGLIGAEANGTNTVGVAFNANLTGVNIFDPSGSNSDIYVNSADPTKFFEAIRQSANFDVVNNSWGSTPQFGGSQNANVDGSFSENVLDGWEFAALNGRAGRGTVIVVAAGNDDMGSNGDSLSSSRYSISVAAVADSGLKASYSNFGADILVSAGGGGDGLGIVTTDLLGTEGINTSASPSGDFTNAIAGTSFAAPIVAGVVALMLDANPGLGWRDVQNILAASATFTGDPSALTSTEHEQWFINKANTWNGGGYHFSEDYGFGQVNAYNAVRMAETWLVINGAAATSTNEFFSSVLQTSIAKPISDFATTTHALAVSGIAQDIDHLEVTVGLTHSFFAALDIYLVSPEGTEILLAKAFESGQSGGAATSGITWTFGVEGLRGENINGTWTLRVTDVDGEGDTGTLQTFGIAAYASAQDTKDVYIFTDEFASLRAADPTRGTLTDSNGGSDDWVNAVAVTSNSTIDLRGTGFNSTIAGATLVISNVENAYGGDGNDQITGTDGVNLIYGGRGTDTFVAGGGADTLVGGAGADTMYGGGGDDSFYVDVAGDKAFDGSGTDTLYSATIALNLASANYLNIENATLTGAANLGITGSSLANTLIGNSGNNVIVGGGGIDTMYGGGGNDSFYVDVAGDKAFDGAGLDTLLSATIAIDLASTNYLNIENAQLTAAANLNLLGSSGVNALIGNVGQNFIEGRGAADVLTGGGGVDRFIFRQSLGAASGNDRITDFLVDDFIRIDSLAVSSLTALTAGQFVLGTVALDADDRVMYDQTTGVVRFDADGNGAGASIAIFTLDTKPAISFTEFELI